MTTGSNHLLRVLGLAFGLAAVVGSVVGQGILRSPGVVAEATSSPALIIALWIAGALVAIISAFAFAELGAAIPRAGGAYAFVYRAFGERIGVFGALCLLLNYVATVAMLSFVTGEFMVRLGVGGGRFNAVELGIAVTALFAVLNSLGTKVTGGSQIALSSLKGMALVALVIVLFANPGAASPSESQAELLRSGWIPIGTALLVVTSTYGGWADVVFYGEELDNPGKQIPRALFGGILSVTVLYVLINLAFLNVMTPAEMAGSNLVAADAAAIVFGERGDVLLTLFGVLSVGAIANLSVMTNTRIVFAMARGGMLPAVLTRVDKRGTPMLAMLSVTIVSAGLILIGGYTELNSMLLSLNQMLLVLVILAVVGLRRKEPELVRPYKVPLYPVPILIAALLNAVLLVIFVIQDPWYSLSGFAAVAIIWFVYFYVLKLRATLEPLEEEA